MSQATSEEHPHHDHGNLTQHILIAMISGVIVGWLIYLGNLYFGDAPFMQWLQKWIVAGVLFVGSKMFVASLKMMVVPLVFVSLVCGVAASGSGDNITRMGLKTLAIYICTTAVAITLALSLATMVQPGSDAQLDQDITYVPKEPPKLKDVIISMVPTNPVRAMAEANMLQLIVFSLLVGLAVAKTGQVGEKVKHTFEQFNVVILKMVGLVMHLAPAGVFCLVTIVFAEKGMSFITALLSYVLTVVTSLLVHGALTFTVLIYGIAKLNPVVFFRKAFPAMLFAFSTASSAATMPITLRIAEKAMGVRNAIASFTVPLGATINMDGTAIMQGVATVFIAGAYGVDLTLVDYATVVLTATLASVGTAAVPGAGMITLSMVLLQVGLPNEAIGLILGVDRILDMMRTAVNVTGDLAVTTVVAKSEKKFNKDMFEDEEATATD